MFTHIFHNRLRCLLRDKELIFWTMMFPLVLATLFQLAFGNISASELFEPIDIAVVDDVAYQKNQSLAAVLSANATGEERLFNLVACSQEEADKLLADRTIYGYIVAETPIRLVVNKSGIQQNILRSFLNTYLQTASTAEKLISKNPANAAAIIADLMQHQEYTNEVTTGAYPDSALIYFFSLIAMACFYGGFFGSNEITDIQANISARAARINIAPVHKLKVLVSSAAASFLIHFVEMLVLVMYMVFVLGVDFGSKFGLVLATLLLGSFTGISFGAFISALVKKSEGLKIAILIGSTMLGATLAGLSYADVKYVIAKHVPILSWINPVNLLSDAFYSLYSFDILSRYLLNMLVLALVSLLMCTITYMSIRRKKYANI